MSVVKAACPRCRSEVDTGLVADERTMAECRELRVLVLCDGCRSYQKLLVKELYLADDPIEAAA